MKKCSFTKRGGLSEQTDHVHMALMVAAPAAAMGNSDTLFFSKRGAFAVTDGGLEKLRSSCGRPAAEMDEQLSDNGVADFPILMDVLAALDVNFQVFESALAEHAISKSDLLLRPYTEESDFAALIEKRLGGDWLTF